MHGHKSSHLPIRYFLALLWAHPILHISTIRVKHNRNELPNFIKHSKYDQENPSGGQWRMDMTRQVFAIRFADVSLNSDMLTDCICSLGKQRLFISSALTGQFL